MAVRVSLVATGFDDIMKSWDNFSEDISSAAKEGIDDALAPIAGSMRTNTTMMFNKGYMEGVMVESVSHTATVGDDGNAYGSVGVYDMSRKTGSGDRRLPAPELAYMYEHGIRPHSTVAGVKLEQLPTEKNPRGRPAKGKQGRMMHQGSPPIPFLSSAWDANNQRITPTLLKAMKKETDKL